MVDVGRRRAAHARRGVPATRTPARPASTSTGRTGRTATGDRRSRTRCCSSPLTTTSSERTAHAVRVGRRRRRRAPSSSGGGCVRRLRRGRHAPRPPSAHGPDWGPHRRASRCSAASASPGVPSIQRLAPRRRARSRSPSRPRGRDATWSGSTPCTPATPTDKLAAPRSWSDARGPPRPARPRPGDGLWAVVDLPAGHRHRVRHPRSRPPGPVLGRHRRGDPSPARPGPARRPGVPPPRPPRRARGSEVPGGLPCRALTAPTRDRSSASSATLAERGRHGARPRARRLPAQLARRTLSPPSAEGAGLTVWTPPNRRAQRAARASAAGPTAARLSAVSSRRCARSRPLRRHLAAPWLLHRGCRLHRGATVRAGLRHPRAAPSSTANPASTSPDSAHRVRFTAWAARAGATADPVRRIPRAYMPAGGGHAAHETTSPGSRAAPSRRRRPLPLKPEERNTMSLQPQHRPPTGPAGPPRPLAAAPPPQASSSRRRCDRPALGFRIFRVRPDARSSS